MELYGTLRGNNRECAKKSVNKNTFYDEIKSGGIFYEKETFKRKANFDNANDRNV